MAKVKALAIALTGLLFLSGAADAQQSVEQYFRGKTVNIYIGSAVGGGYDAYGRLVARHLGKHIPGNPAVVPQNMPGAGSNKAAGYVALQAPRDGTAIAAIQPGAVLWPLLYDQPVPHDPSKFIPIGSATSDVYLCMARSDAGVTSFKDVLTSKEVIVGTSGEGSAIRDMPTILVNVLGAKLKLIGGYPGSREVLVAMERGEVQGICGMGWSSIAMQHSDWIKSGFIKILVQEDLKGHPEVTRMGVPLSVDFARTEEDRQVMQLIYSESVFGRPYLLPPGVPADRVAALRKAFMETLADKELLADADRAKLDIVPMSGEDMQALVAKLYALPAKVSERAKQALIYKPQAR